MSARAYSYIQLKSLLLDSRCSPLRASASTSLALSCEKRIEFPLSMTVSQSALDVKYKFKSPVLTCPLTVIQLLQFRLCSDDAVII